MPSNIIKYKIIVSSPDDIVEEHNIIDEVIKDWNNANSDFYEAILEHVSWKTHTTSEMGDRPQAIINKQLELKKCDILAAIFWMRLGTPTGKAESGTVEEIEEFLKLHRPLSIYFSLKPVQPDNIEIEQYRRLSEIKDKYKNKGLIVTYKSIDDFKNLFRMDITKKINSIHKGQIKVPDEHDTIIKNEIAKPLSLDAVLTKNSEESRSVQPNITSTKTLNPRVFDERKLPRLSSAQLPSYKWNVQNFEGFFYDLKDDLGKESLRVLQENLGAGQRTIGRGKLIYYTASEPKKLKVIEEAFGHNVADAAVSGLEQTEPGKAFENGQYRLIGWQGEKYVAINGKVDKLSKLIIEQGTSQGHEMTLVVGESWDIGDGWIITANAIDARATPKQAWLTLSKDGIKKDDKVVSEKKRIYTYVEKSLAGENDVPMFVTYVDSISEGATTDIIQLRYTWAISSSVTQIKSSDTYGVFTDAIVSGKALVLTNSNTEINLIQNAIVNLMGDLKFKVADRADVLRFYPTALR
jgi:S-layer protein (TIGR01567 family)